MAAKADDEYVSPSSPAGYLMWHIIKKGWQAGSVVGVAAVLPTMYLIRKVRDPTALLRALGYSAAIGTAATGTLGVLKCTQIDQEGFEDRAYRLHYNQGQNRTDAFSAAGAAVGLAAAALLLPRGAPPLSYAMAAAGVSAVGTALGVAAHVASSSSSSSSSRTAAVAAQQPA
ncbi:hypothetical protein GPECTOR_73g639 [Gonium pectorale]|uniref:Uncharacterized protein n=1 Tax=Gonium pectorale TaxID=33097 RepID=A0A150G2Q1_GONPE|nr:hypothetical protein GPECTOR_73g639 [Gonium pectorale]|eukprot:KXZ44118.1 hypothetical protein GPECTOR_73g639 [Gonium pectorale]